jgi:general L-amino acid transport system permease protein
MHTGFSFLFLTAGFDTDFKLIDYQPGVGTYGRIFFIGVLNTLFISFFAIVASTVIAFVVGIARVSPNWLVSRLALAYVELIRNTPILMQIVMWHVTIFFVLPKVRQSTDLLGLGVAFLNNRGLYMPSPIPGDSFWMTMVALVVGCFAAFLIRRWARRRQERTGQQFPSFWAGLGVVVILPGVVYLGTGMPLAWDLPELKGFNYVGGVSLPPAFLALLVALTINHSSDMAESVRAGILSVSRGQTEAANALGLRPGRVMRLVIIPQAMLAIVPPMISTWMNVVKNSSLAVAIGYSDVVALFMQTSLNQSGHAIEIVAITMLFYGTISLSISFVMNIYNKRVQLRER